MKMKLGVDYDYLLFIKQATPENAVILYPSQEAFLKKGSPFKREIGNKLYATRFPVSYTHLTLPTKAFV